MLDDLAAQAPVRKFGKQLPDAMELVARALRAGHSLASGFSLVADEMTAPIGKEFGRVFEEQNLGIPMDEALETHDHSGFRISICGSSPRPSFCSGKPAATWPKFSTRSATWSASDSRSWARCRP